MTQSGSVCQGRAAVAVVLCRAEADALPRCRSGTVGLVAWLLYAAGLRWLEAARLRVKDLDLTRLEREETRMLEGIRVPRHFALL